MWQKWLTLYAETFKANLSGIWHQIMYWWASNIFLSIITIRQQNYELFLECWNTSDVIFQTIVFSLSKGGNKSLCTNQKVITLLKRFRNRKRFRGLNHCLVLCIQLSSYRQYSVLALLENSSEEISQTEPQSIVGN